MPIYEYRCEDCGNRFDLLRSYSDRQNVNCPRCSSEKVKQRLSAFNTGGRRNLNRPERCDTCSMSGGCKVKH